MHGNSHVENCRSFNCLSYFASPCVTAAGHDVVGVDCVEAAAWQLQRDAWLKFEVDQVTTPGAGGGKRPDFIAAPTFVEERSGYVFKTGDKGTGYYLDAKVIKVSGAFMYAVSYPQRVRPAPFAQYSGSIWSLNVTYFRSSSSPLTRHLVLANSTVASQWFRDTKRRISFAVHDFFHLTPSDIGTFDRSVLWLRGVTNVRDCMRPAFTYYWRSQHKTTNRSLPVGVHFFFYAHI